MGTAEIFGAWLAVFLTLAILSYLYDDNPFYKAAEHIFVGVSSGYWAATYFWTQIQPNLFGRLWIQLDGGKTDSLWQTIWYGIYKVLAWLVSLGGLVPQGIFPEGGIAGYDEIRYSYLIPFALGIFMLMRLFPKVGWLARWALAYIVGMAAGLRFYGYLNSDVMNQIASARIDMGGNWVDILNGIIVMIGTITGLLYFFFSREHKGATKVASRVGIWFLMISFGASFGFAVMGRISLLIGRFNDLIKYSNANYHHASWWILGLMIVGLLVWSFQRPGDAEA